MVADLPTPIGAGVYDVYTGAPVGDSYTGAPAGDVVPLAARLGLEPPRYCAECGRRMVVQVRPDGWWAQCSRHGRVDSADLDVQR
ncbi:MAG: hypothetical protein NT146_14710 [Mycobacterium sp.]|nr:hypothetical protein [Mycobacterium sp.]